MKYLAALIFLITPPFKIKGRKENYSSGKEVIESSKEVICEPPNDILELFHHQEHILPPTPMPATPVKSVIDN